MFKIKRKIISLLVGVMVVLQFSGINCASAIASQSTRIAGANRYETSNAIASTFWEASDYAVLARGDEYPDALCAAPLAYAYDAPILLTDPKVISESTLNVLSKLKVKTIFIVGGTSAVSVDIEKALKSNYAVLRISGQDRYETSVLVAKKIKEKLGTVPTIALATGKNFPDALSISSIAAKKGMPILLTEANALPKSVDSFIKDNSVKNTYVIGGVGVISNTVFGQVPAGKRLAGNDRFATNVEILKEFADVLNFNKLFVAVGKTPDGKGFADALSGSAAAAKFSAPLILTEEVVPTVTENYLLTKVSGLTNLVILGGTKVVPTSVETKLLSDINIPTLTNITLTDSASGHSVAAKIEEPVVNTNSGRITFDIPSAYNKFDGGTATLSEDLKSASISSFKISRTVSNIKKTDDFAKIIFEQIAAEGYDPSNGILSSNIKYLLDGATITLTDLDGNVKTYTIIINII